MSHPAKLAVARSTVPRARRHSAAASVQNGNVYVTSSAPTNGAVGWAVWFHNKSSGAVTVYAWVICANVTS
jgi:hypothetical protein